jgi:O-antigen/teichoic acid export membrane protein
LGAVLVGNLPAVWILGFAFANNVLSVIMHVFIGFERVLLSQWVGSVLRPILLVAGFFGLALLASLSVGGAMMIQIGAALICALSLWLIWLANGAMMRVKQNDGHKPSYSDYTVSLVTGWKFAVAQLAIMGMTQVDILILTATRTAEEVAWYFAAARAALVASFFFSSVTKMAEPKLVRLFAAQDQDEMRGLATSTARLGLGMTLIATILSFVAGGFYLDLFGEGYRNAYPAMIVLMAGLLARSFFGPAEAVLRASRSDTGILVYAVLSLGVGSALAYALSMQFGMIGVATGMAVQFVLFGLLLSRKAFLETGISTTAIQTN